MKKGSEWRKWNFHVHTKNTNKNDQFSSKTMEEFYHTFFKEACSNGISAIGVTDYFSIDRYKDAIEYRANINKKVSPEGEALFTEEEINFIQRIFIFPNVELRMLPSTDKARLINIHCLFNPEYIADLDNDFFSNIENQEKFKMNRHGIMSYGKTFVPTLSDGNQEYKRGIDNFVINLESLKDLVYSNKRFKDNTLFFVSNSNKDGASAIQKHYDLFNNESGSLNGLRKSIYNLCDGIFSATLKDIKYFLGRKSEDVDGYNEEIYKMEALEVITNTGSLKPCVVGCDAHTENDLFTRFTWVKADLNFEGLRQICFEPEQRVKIQSAKPEYKEDKLVIDSVNFISSKNVFSTKPIFLNPNLNVIIGGKSSGKSILLYSIAKTLLADSEVLKNEDGNFKYDLNKIDTDFNFQITTTGGFSQNLYRQNDENSILPEIKYIPQNYLVKLAEPALNKKGKSLNKIVRDLITEDIESKEVYQNFIFNVKQNDKLRNSKIDEYFETKAYLDALEGELKTKSKKEVLEKNIETNAKKVDAINKSIGLTPEQIEKYKLLQKKIEENKSNLQKLKEDHSLLRNFNSEIIQTVGNLKLKKDAFIQELQLQELKDFYLNVYANIDSLYKEISEIDIDIQIITDEEGNKLFKNNASLNALLKNLRIEKDRLFESIQPFLKGEEEKKSIDLLNQSISEDKKALVDIDNLTNKIQEKKKLLFNIKDELFRMYEGNYKEYSSVIEALKERTIELEKDGLKITGKAQFNFPKLRNTLIPISDGRRASFKEHSVLNEKNKSTSETKFPDILKSIKILFDDIIGNNYILTSKTSIPNTIKVILDDYFFDYWEIKYKNDMLGEMSTGKASFVILMLIIGLSKSKAPILIDQPEDNLDNRSITTDLVNYLRNKKLERQIIIVTHNANIVVNADAENVIVANQKGQNDEESTSIFKFDYINGAIENSFEKLPTETDVLKSMGIRQHIADIVEGGKEAFIMREKKYRFK